jgi:hypothetical protein
MCHLCSLVSSCLICESWFFMTLFCFLSGLLTEEFQRGTLWILRRPADLFQSSTTRQMIAIQFPAVPLYWFASFISDILCSWVWFWPLHGLRLVNKDPEIGFCIGTDCYLLVSRLLIRGLSIQLSHCLITSAVHFINWFFRVQSSCFSSASFLCSLLDVSDYWLMRWLSKQTF